MSNAFGVFGFLLNMIYDQNCKCQLNTIEVSEDFESSKYYTNDRETFV